MALTPRLDLRQSQSLVMTPQMQQAIKLLQLSNMEITAYVEAELERNPLLERDEGQDDIPADPAPPEPDRAETEPPFMDAVPGTDSTPLDMDVDNTWNSGDLPGEAAYVGVESSLADWQGSGGRSDFGEDMAGPDQTLVSPRTLREDLTEQINLAFEDAADRLMALGLLEGLDENGYFTADLTEVAARLRVPEATLARLLTTLQTLEPTGLFARSLPECLALQLQERDRMDPAMAALVDHLSLLERRDYARLREVCGVDDEDLADMIAELRTLDPRPAQRLAGDPIQPITPDVTLRARPDGTWHLELNSETLPRVLVNTRYYTTVSNVARSPEEKQYLSEHYQNANWLVRALHQRATTILKVAGEIVRQQDAFLHHGITHLRPLVLRDVAEAVEMHESTVSRVTSNKYIMTPRGIFELKYFFTQALGGANGATHSAETVRHRIRTLIDEEPPAKVLSDERIATLLCAEGIDIARRTVAKYREAMNIPSSSRRRREKALQGASRS